MQNLTIICFLLVSSSITVIRAQNQTECLMGKDFTDLSADCGCPLHFEVCSQPQVHTIGVGDNVLSKCILNTMARADLERIEIFYHNCTTNGSCSTNMYIATDTCSSTANIPGLNFELVVSRPDKYNATIYIFNVTEETSLNVYCDAKNPPDPMDPLSTPITISTSALMITFIMSNTSSNCSTSPSSCFMAPSCNTTTTPTCNTMTTTLYRSTPITMTTTLYRSSPTTITMTTTLYRSTPTTMTTTPSPMTMSGTNNTMHISEVDGLYIGLGCLGGILGVSILVHLITIVLLIYCRHKNKKATENGKNPANYTGGSKEEKSPSFRSTGETEM